MKEIEKHARNDTGEGDMYVALYMRYSTFYMHNCHLTGLHPVPEGLARAKISMMLSTKDTAMIKKSKLFHTRSGPKKKSAAPKALSFKSISMTYAKTMITFTMLNHRGTSLWALVEATSTCSCYSIDRDMIRYMEI